MYEITGDEPDERDPTKKRTEVVELWRRDPVDCIRELIGNPAFRDSMRYAPERLYKDKNGKNQVFDEMWTGDWWWKTQVSCKVCNVNKQLELTRSSTVNSPTETFAAWCYNRACYTVFG